MKVDLMYLTGSRARKRQKRSTQLEEYFEDLRDDITTALEHQIELLHDPWRWWLEVGRNKYLVVFKMATDFLSLPATSCERERCFSTAKRDDYNRSQPPQRGYNRGSTAPEELAAQRRRRQRPFKARASRQELGSGRRWQRRQRQQPRCWQ